MTEVNRIKITCNMSDPQGKIIPRGVREVFTAEIVDNMAAWYFRNPKTTELFVRIENAHKEKGKDTKYLERIKKAITLYDGKPKEEIRDIILKQLKQLGLNAKVHNG